LIYGEEMISTTTIITFMVASVAIILAPGPAQALVLTRSISAGQKAGIMTAVGLNIGTMFHAVVAALGLSAILATSAMAFSIVKYIGAGYLLYLGIKAIKEKTTETEFTNQGGHVSSTRTLSKAIVTGILNPKVAIFFLAFLPQFVEPERGYVFGQFILLGSILAGMDILYEALLASIAGKASEWLGRNQQFLRWRQKVSGVVLIGLGVKLAFVRQE